jgi:predicted transcriptional regulator
MRTLIDVDKPDIDRLDQIAAVENRSRASLVREAIREFVDKKQVMSIDAAFGAWGNRKVDGLTYQRRIRDEW